MKIREVIIYFIFSFTMCSCAEDRQRLEIEYFDMEGLLAQQMEALNRINPSLEKKASINGVEEKEVKILDSAGWATELSILMEADINKPRLIGNYEKEIALEDNKKIVFYNSVDPDEVQVEYVKFVYQQDALSSIESLFIEKNILYNTRRKILMNFKKDDQGEPLLSDYQIIGKQKMIFKDTISYNIDSKISF